MTACVPGRSTGSLASSAPISSRSGPACSRRCGGPGEDSRHDRGQGGAVERRPALDGGVQGGAQGPHVRGRAGVAALQLFRGHVVRGADPYPGAGQLRRGVDDPGDAEIGHDGLPARQQDVVRLQVTVHDAGRVRVRERVRDLLADLRRPLPGSRPSRAISAPSDGPEMNCITIHGAPSCSTTS